MDRNSEWNFPLQLIAMAASWRQLTWGNCRLMFTDTVPLIRAMLWEEGLEMVRIPFPGINIRRGVGGKLSETVQCATNYQNQNEINALKMKHISYLLCH